jgi:hypothetical protein
MLPQISVPGAAYRKGVFRTRISTWIRSARSEATTGLSSASNSTAFNPTAFSIGNVNGSSLLAAGRIS